MANWESDNVSILFNLSDIPVTCCRTPGDINHDGTVDLLDFQYLRDFLHKDGPEPPCFEEGDINGDGEITEKDISCLARYLFSKEKPCLPAECS